MNRERVYFSQQPHTTFVHSKEIMKIQTKLLGHNDVIINTLGSVDLAVQLLGCECFGEKSFTVE